MVNVEFFRALEAWEREKRIDAQILIESLEAGMASAFKRESGDARPIKVNLNRETATITVLAYRDVVEEVDNYDTQIAIEDAKEIRPDIQIGQVLYEDISPADFSRIAAQTAKQVILQRLNDAKKQLIMNEMAEREGELLTAIVRRVESENIYVEMVGTQLEGILMQKDQIRSESYRPGELIRVYVKSMRDTPKGSQVVVSRSVAGFVKRLFEMEVPEIKAGLVVVKNIVREAGMRTKISVYSEDMNVDAVGALIGSKGMRINAVVQELGGEKVDVIGYTDDPLEYIARALTPAKVLMVQINEEEKSARAIVADDKLSLAIGKGGHNVKLAARLTGWKVDIKPYSEVFNVGSEEHVEAVDVTSSTEKTVAQPTGTEGNSENK